MEAKDLDNLESDETEQAETQLAAESAVGESEAEAQSESPEVEGDAEVIAESAEMPEVAVGEDPGDSEAEPAEELSDATPDDTPLYPEPSDEHGLYLLVDGGQAGEIAASWQSELNKHELGVPFIFANAEEAKAKLLSGGSWEWR